MTIMHIVFNRQRAWNLPESNIPEYNELVGGRICFEICAHVCGHSQLPSRASSIRPKALVVARRVTESILSVCAHSLALHLRRSQALSGALRRSQALYAPIGRHGSADGRGAHSRASSTPPQRQSRRRVRAQSARHERSYEIVPPCKGTVPGRIAPRGVEERPLVAPPSLHLPR